MSKISEDKLEELKKYYYQDKLCMRQIAENFQVSIDAVTYFMRKHHLKRRDFSTINRLRFDNKPLSFMVNQEKSNSLEEIKIIGAMLYWCEGYKSDKAGGIDFANSDPMMISAFLKFLREVYTINEKRLRVLIYCHSNQDQNKLIKYWSNLTNIPTEQFTKPYVRQDQNKNFRIMEWGLVHIRYCDKKLLLEVKKLINDYLRKYQITN